MDYLKNFFQNNKGKLAIGGFIIAVLALFDFKLIPEAREKVAEVKKIVEKAIKERVEKKIPFEENIIPIKEDFTASEFVGVTVYIDGERHRLTLTIEQRDILMGIAGEIEYVKRAGGASQVDVLLMLACADRFPDSSAFYEKCIDMVYEDFQSGKEDD